MLLTRVYSLAWTRNASAANDFRNVNNIVIMSNFELQLYKPSTARLQDPPLEGRGIYTLQNKENAGSDSKLLRVECDKP